MSSGWAWTVAALALLPLAGCIEVQVPAAEPQVVPEEGDGARTVGPVVDFTWLPAAPVTGQAVRFQPSAKVVAGTGVESWAWSFGDGATSARATPDHAYAAAGPYTVRVVLRTSDGLSAEAAHVVPVTARAQQEPAGDAPAAEEPAELPDPVISAAAEGLAYSFSFSWPAEPDSVGWDFGDGTTSNEVAPRHEYARPGRYEVHLHVLREDQVRSAMAQVVAGQVYSFVEAVVTPAVDFSGDLYEPTLEVSDTGTIYITGHTILVDTTGAPVWFSRDQGATWKQLPFASTVSLPSPLQGATPPPSDEIFLAAGDDGWLYGVDITLATFPVNAWKGDGAEFAYHNPNAYDESDAGPGDGGTCVPVPVKDRPWGAYANGTLLMVSNPASGPAQVGVLRVPPAAPVGVGAGTAQWNLCAGPGGRIPGIPDLREDGAFAVPQLDGDGRLHVVVGDAANVRGSHVVEAFPVETSGEITSVYGIAAFDRPGTLFVGVTNNTEPDSQERQRGQLRIAASQDAGEHFVVRTFPIADRALRHFYMDPNDFGRGALVVWAVDGSSEDGYDWYTGHVQLGSDGGPVLENVLLAIDEGPAPSAHVTGAAVGPDGRAYLAMYRPDALGGTPLSVFIQQGGPTLPVG